MNVSTPLPGVVLSLCLGFLSAHPAAALAQQPVRFPERPARVLVTPPFADREVAQLLATLDKLLAPGSEADVKASLWEFGRRIQGGYLTSTQESLVVRHLDAILLADPTRAPFVAGARRMVTELAPGKRAPEIVGTDLDGAPLRLSDYRGKVVVLVFSAEWCSICRTLDPYERFMLDLYEKWPFAIVSVETGESRDSVRRLKSQQGLRYSSFWDESSKAGVESAGAIATSWNATGFPTVYVLDGEGVIRFVDLRYEDLLKGVRQLLTEEMAAAEQPTRRAGRR